MGRQVIDHGAYPCSFCGKAEVHGVSVIVGPCVNICGECVGLCVDILAEMKAPAPPRSCRTCAARCPRVDAPALGWRCDVTETRWQCAECAKGAK